MPEKLNKALEYLRQKNPEYHSKLIYILTRHPHLYVPVLRDDNYKVIYDLAEGE